MRLARARLTDDRIWLGRREDDTFLPLVAQQDWPGHDPLREALAAGLDLAAAPAAAEPVAGDGLCVLAPVAAPSKVLAIGLNYRDHAEESGAALPKAPLLFVKTPNSIIGPDEPIRWAADASREVDYEAELAVVIGRRATNVSEGDALAHVLGYTACNDVSARDAQFGDGQWVRGKSFDTFCPLGPVLVGTDELPDPQALRIGCRVNGTQLQDGTTADMIFSVAELVSYLSRFLTLEPGDVIATGTPLGVGFARDPQVFLSDGDVVEVEVEGIGVLSNPVRTT